MGEQKIPVMVKMPQHLLVRLDREREMQRPIPSRSAMGACLIEDCITARDAGILPRIAPHPQLLPRNTAEPLHASSYADYTWKGIARSERDAEEFLAELMQTIVGTEPHIADWRRQTVVGRWNGAGDAADTDSDGTPTVSKLVVGAEPRRAGHRGGIDAGRKTTVDARSIAIRDSLVANTGLDGQGSNIEIGPSRVDTGIPGDAFGSAEMPTAPIPKPGPVRASKPSKARMRA